MKDDLSKIYVEMYEVELTLDSIDESFSLQEEGKSGHGKKSDVQNLLKEYMRQGKITVKDTSSGYKVISTKDPNLYEFIHKGERAFHYLRRFLQKLDKLA